MADEHKHYQDGIDAARLVMDNRIDALNSKHCAAVTAKLHSPHYRLSDGYLKVCNHHKPI